MNKDNITKHLKTSVRILDKAFGLEPTLSEILSLRRYIVEAEANIPRESRENIIFGGPVLYFEAIVQLFDTHYGIDLMDLLKRGPNGKVAIPIFSDLIADGLKIRPEFKAYLRRKQQEQYFP